MVGQFWLELGAKEQGKFRLDEMPSQVLKSLGEVVAEYYDSPVDQGIGAWKNAVKLTTEVPKTIWESLWDEEREEVGDIIGIAETSGENLRLIVYGEKLDLTKITETLPRLRRVLDRLKLT